MSLQDDRKEKQLKMTRKLAAFAGMLVLGGSFAFTSAPAFASVSGASVSGSAGFNNPYLTERAMISGEGAFNDLDSCQAVGDTVEFSKDPTGCYQPQWYFQAEGNVYYIHPLNETGNCVTLSTTQTGVIKIETCVDAPNQLFENLEKGSGTPGDYLIYNSDLGVYINDPHTGSTGQHVAGTIVTCSYAENGCAFLETA